MMRALTFSTRASLKSTTSPFATDTGTALQFRVGSNIDPCPDLEFVCKHPGICDARHSPILGSIPRLESDIRTCSKLFQLKNNGRKTQLTSIKMQSSLGFI